MKVIHISSMDIRGGANLAAFRLVQAQRDAGMESVLCVQEKSSDALSVITAESLLGIQTGRFRRFLEKHLTRLLARNANQPYSACLVPGCGVNKEVVAGADIVHLHHVGQGTLSMGYLEKVRCPVVWTLHDMWPFLGGDHYRRDDDLEQFRGNDTRLDQWIWRRKKDLYARMRPFLVSPSHWLAECARKAELSRSLPVEVIPNPTSGEYYPETDREGARRRLGLPQGSSLLLFGADQSSMLDPRKGLDLLLAALKSIEGSCGNLELVAIGHLNQSTVESFPFPVRCLGQVDSPERLRAIYNAVDAFVVPSRQDNLPNMAVESLACGTPVCGFHIGGLPDLVLEGERGCLANPFDTGMLGKCVETTIALGKKAASRAACAQFVAESLGSGRIADQYKDLYEQILGGARTS